MCQAYIYFLKVFLFCVASQVLLLYARARLAREMSSHFFLRRCNELGKKSASHIFRSFSLESKLRRSAFLENIYNTYSRKSQEIAAHTHVPRRHARDVLWRLWSSIPRLWSSSRLRVCICVYRLCTYLCYILMLRCAFHIAPYRALCVQYRASSIRGNTRVLYE